jgi:hypothetical protein
MCEPQRLLAISSTILIMFSYLFSSTFSRSLLCHRCLRSVYQHLISLFTIPTFLSPTMRAFPSLLFMLSTLIILTRSTTTCAHPFNTVLLVADISSPSPHHNAPSPRACSNTLLNPSFEARTLCPWTIYYSGSWPPTASPRAPHTTARTSSARKATARVHRLLRSLRPPHFPQRVVRGAKPGSGPRTSQT